MQKDTVVVACNVLDLSYKNLRIFEILRENGFDPDVISKDLISIINNENDSLINLQSLEIELKDLAIASDVEFTTEDFYSEIDNIMFNIVYRLNEIRIRNKRLIALHFVEPHDIFFIFR